MRVPTNHYVDNEDDGSSSTDSLAAGRTLHATLPIPPSAFPALNVKGKTTIVPAAHGFAFHLHKNQRFRIIDLHGSQVIDMMAWGTLPSSSPSSSTSANANIQIDPHHRLSMSYTRYHLLGATPTEGEHLYSNHDTPMLKILKDRVKVHDMTFMSCNPPFYAAHNLPGHRSCASNIAEAMQPFGVSGGWKEVSGGDPFNVFQNTPYYTLKGGLGSSRAGDFVEFEAMGECVVAVSCCPFEVGGFNGGRVTDVGVVVMEE